MNRTFFFVCWINNNRHALIIFQKLFSFSFHVYIYNTWDLLTHCAKIKNKQNCKNQRDKHSNCNWFRWLLIINDYHRKFESHCQKSMKLEKLMISLLLFVFDLYKCTCCITNYVTFEHLFPLYSARPIFIQCYHAIVCRFLSFRMCKIIFFPLFFLFARNMFIQSHSYWENSFSILYSFCHYYFRSALNCLGVVSSFHWKMLLKCIEFK